METAVEKIIVPQIFQHGELIKHKFSLFCTIFML